METKGLFDDKEKSGPVECLGINFSSEEERREYFREKLKENSSEKPS